MQRFKLILWPATPIGRMTYGIFLLSALTRHVLVSPHYRADHALATTAPFVLFSVILVSAVRTVLVLAKVIAPVAPEADNAPAVVSPLLRKALEKHDEIAQQYRPVGEILQTYLMGVSRPNLGWYFVLGPLASLGMRKYQVLVTDRSYVFLKYGMFDNVPRPVGTFSRADVGLPQRSNSLLVINLRFDLPSGRKLNLKVTKMKALGMLERVDRLYARDAA